MLGMTKHSLHVDGMHCSKCEAKVTQALTSRDDVAKATAQASEGLVTVTLKKSSKLSKDDVYAIIKDLGFPPTQNS